MGEKKKAEKKKEKEQKVKVKKSGILQRYCKCACNRGAALDKVSQRLVTGCTELLCIRKGRTAYWAEHFAREDPKINLKLSILSNYF